MAETRRIRKDPGQRRAELVASARAVFSEIGFAEAGLAEIAAANSVSKGLVYHYFPRGRAELFVTVTEDVLAELRAALHEAARAPFSAKVRMEELLAVFFRYFDDDPDALRLLFRDPWASREPELEAAGLTTNVRIAADLASVLTDVDHSAEELVAVSTGILGFAIATIELCQAGQLDSATALRITQELAIANLS